MHTDSHRRVFRIARICLAAGIVASGVHGALAQDLKPVTVENYARAETDHYFAAKVKVGAFGKFVHRREPTRVEEQNVVRMNRDTLMSLAVFDLDAGPVTITLPDPGGRLMSMQVVNEDHYTPLQTYAPGQQVLTRENVGTRYVMVGVRTLIDPQDPKDVAQAHVLQDALKVHQEHGGTFDVPNWDQKSLTEVRNSLLALASTVPDTRRMFGAKSEVDPIRHLLGTAMGWGGSPEKDALYLNVTPGRNDGTTTYRLSVKDVPVDGFWSVTVYNEKGYFEPNKLGAYSLNNITARKSANGAINIQFGGCDGKLPNCLPTMKGWNYMVRLYRPRAEILTGKWSFPEAEPVQ
ncbi:DUF1254 domain-containing protein [Cupriavidus sp. BIS7]|uniref:DUF1214 domain-containing protein n=1 Tax=Cupriavidus sp. BIS7 TaxID=1217718 RepID=UPI0002EE92CE|nr:DUF1254 domain-containing protein [Cupriavidus sp. BIS7]